MDPFLPEHVDEPREDCNAPAGTYCRPDCPTGYTAEDARYTRAPEALSPWEPPPPPGW